MKRLNSEGSIVKQMWNVLSSSMGDHLESSSTARVEQQLYELNILVWNEDVVSDVMHVADKDVYGTCLLLCMY
jgi:hypothetical protein